MIDRAIALFGLAIALIIGLYTFAPEGWPKMAPSLTLSGICLGILILGIGIGLIIGDQRRALKPDFDIEFDPKDDQFVDVREDRTIYSVGLRNKSPVRSIFFPSIRAQNTELTNHILTEREEWGRPDGAMIIFIANVLDPHALETVHLFTIPTNGPHIHDELLSRRHRFTLEARGRDAKTRRVDFEYDPSTTPRLRKC